MSPLADYCLANGATVVGVSPRFIQEMSVFHDNLSQMIITDTIHQCQDILRDISDVTVALPGGPGALVRD